jgi:dTDP-4-amino-4,6-dideoxygalactose transaminase
MSRSVLEAATKVPFVDLTAVNEPIAGNLLRAIADLVDSGQFVNGPQIAAFEDAFAEWCGVRWCVGVASGLDALRLGLVAAGLDPGDEVVVPALTFIATAEAVTHAGGRLLLADVSEDDWNLDPAAAEAACSRHTRFVVPVHLYGQLADLATLVPLADRLGLGLLEDACQAHGAERDGILAGSRSVAAAFSFYPAKNLGAMGDAGALVTSDATLADAVRVLREHGQRHKYRHEVTGWTSRLDTIQAIVLLLKLPALASGNEQRRSAAAFYTAALEGIGDLVTPPVPAGSSPVWHLYVVRTFDPEGLAASLAARGISTGRHYPLPIHLTDAYAHLRQARGSFPVAEALARECLSLPMFAGISEAQLSAVADAAHAHFARRRGA